VLWRSVYRRTTKVGYLWQGTEGNGMDGIREHRHRLAADGAGSVACISLTGSTGRGRRFSGQGGFVLTEAFTENVRIGPVRAVDDEGMGLIDVLLAFSILLLVMAGIVTLLVSLIGNSANASSQQVGKSIAVGVIQEQRSIAAASPTSFPPALLPAPGSTPAVPVTTAATWCPATNPCTKGALLTQSEGSVTYTIYLTGGWCAQAQNGTWGNTTSSFTGSLNQASNASSTYTPFAGYWVSVKVAWGPTATQTSTSGVSGISNLFSVVVSGLITGPQGDAQTGNTSAPTTGPIDSCPVGALS